MKKLYDKLFSEMSMRRFATIILIFLIPISIKAQSKLIKGTVTDAKTGEALVGATVKVQDMPTVTATNVNGIFQLPASVNAILVVSYTGYETQRITVSGAALSVKLIAVAGSLNDVVVVGYGTQRKKDLTGAITQIKPDKIADQNPNTVQDIVRGTPGVTVGFEPTAKGGGSIQIRGQRSTYTAGGHNDPLIVLDGTIFYGELSEINPDDIDQIDILKDASASAVYGAKSANGVLIVTTKKGKQGKPVISFTANYGLVTEGAKRPVFNADGYMQYREDFYTAPTYGLNSATGAYSAYQTPLLATQNKNLPGYYNRPTAENLAKYGVSIDQWRAYTTNTVGLSDDEIWARRLNLQGLTLTNFLAGKTYDWYDHTFRTGHNQDYNVSASGASDRINYYMSMGYLSNQGVVVGDNYTAVRSNIKVNGKITDWLDLGANINFQNRTDGTIAADWQRQITFNSPFASYKDDNGNLLVHPMGDTFINNYGYNFDFNKQYMALDRGYTVFNSIFTAKVKLPFNITYTFNGSPRYQFYHNRYFESAEHPDWKGTNGLVDREQSQRFDWSINNTLNWEQTFAKKHRFNITLVQEAEQRQFWQDIIKARNILPSDALGYHETSYGDINKSSYDSNDTKETADGLLARLFYAYDNRYMLTTSFRRDGYSAFGTSNPRANFFSVAVAWTFTNERFFHWKPLTLGKLRVSYGQNGNRSLADPYLALANLGAGVGATMGYLDANGNLIQYKYLTVGRLANPNLHWEKTQALNIGLDFGFLSDRITGSVDYYITPTVDMIMNRTLPGFTGFSSITTNIGKVQNKGVEVSLNTQNIRSTNFSWNSTFGFSIYKNTIKHLYNVYDQVLDAQGNVLSTTERSDLANNWFIGQPISEIWNYQVTGIWQKNEATEAAKYGQRPGDPKVANLYTADDVKNADGTTTPVYNNNDKVFLGQGSAPILWSFRNDFNYKSFNLSVNMYSYWGHKSLIGNYLNQDNGTSLITNLANTYAKPYWTLDNPSSDFARLDAKGPNGVNAPGKLYDRSFIRFDNLTAGYSFSSKLITRAHIQKLRIFGSVRNVAVWRKDKNWRYGDIETFSTNTDNAYKSGIAPRIYTLGLNMTL